MLHLSCNKQPKRNELIPLTEQKTREQLSLAPVKMHFNHDSHVLTINWDEEKTLNVYVDAHTYTLLQITMKAALHLATVSDKERRLLPRSYELSICNHYLNDSEAVGETNPQIVTLEFEYLDELYVSVSVYNPAHYFYTDCEMPCEFTETS